MARSLKKGPFADASLLKKGEFVATRTYRGHGKDEKKSKVR